jgi:glycolate oxidase FAD binding subunit
MTTHTPKTEEEISVLLKEAAKNRTALLVKGGGTRPIGNPVNADATIRATGLSGITLYEPGALTIIAKAGTSLEAMNKALEKENQQLPFEPADYSGLFGIKGKSTIGGVVGTGVSGPRRLQAGGARDSLIGVRFVSGEGEIIKNGGRVMKNVTGYDLVKLMCGSYGTLGVLTEVSFKILPKPEMTGTVLIEGLEDPEAIQAMAKAASSPFDISGAAHATKGVDGEPVTMIRVEGFTESIKYRTGRLKELLAPLVPPTAQISIELDQVKNAAGWRWIRDVEAFHGAEGALWRISTKAGDGPAIAAKIRENLDVDTIYDWAGGLIWMQLPEGASGAESVIRGAVDTMGGHATLFRSDASVGEAIEAFHPEHPRIADISEKLRRQFDPAGILNPGRMAMIRQEA